MQVITGIFHSRYDAEVALRALVSAGFATDKIACLTPGNVEAELESVPVDTAERPGVGKALGAVIGAAGGIYGGALLVAAAVPGVGMVTAAGLLGAAVLGAAGASIGAAAGGSLENSMAEGLPEDEIFVYEDALRKGRTIVIARADDATAAASARQVLKSSGADAIDAARQQWWIGLRSAEHEHYSASGKSFQDDERFYRLGFEAALHARTRCKEFDQVSAEMSRNVEDLERQYPGHDVAEPYTRGYQRGREYYQHLCDESKAA